MRAAILARLGLADDELRGLTVSKRSYDARRRGAIQLIYALDVDVPDPAALLRRFAGDAHLGPSPDTTYQFVARAPAGLALRPVVIGIGPCGLFAGLVLAQMGFRPIILERGKAVRERTVDTFGLWRKSVLNPESNVQFGEGGAGTFSDGKLYSQIKRPAAPRPQGADRVREGRRAGRNPVRQQAAHRHVPAGVDGRAHARRRSMALGGEIRFSSRVDDVLIDRGRRARCAA